MAASQVADVLTAPLCSPPPAVDNTDPPVTLVIATIRGLLLDVLATGDHDRVGAAADSFLDSLDGPC